MEKRGQAILTIILLVVVVIAVVSFITLSNTSPTGNSIMDRIRTLLGGENDSFQDVSTPQPASQGLSVRVIKDQLTLSGIDSSSIYGPPLDGEKAFLLQSSCENGISIGEAIVKNGKAIFKEVELDPNVRYCIVVPGTYSDEFRLKYEFYNTFYRGTTDSTNVICDPSPLSNKPYYCRSTESECEFFGAKTFEPRIPCDIHAKQLTQIRYLCRPNKFLDYGCYNQVDDCIAGVEEVFNGNDADTECSGEARIKNRDVWYLCYCVPESLEPKPGSTLKIGTAISQGIGNMGFVYRNSEELELKRGYPCTQEPDECLICPRSVEAYGRAVGKEYCDPDEKESVHPHFPRGVVSVHSSQESCLEETEFYECRG